MLKSPAYLLEPKVRQAARSALASLPPLPCPPTSLAPCPLPCPQPCPALILAPSPLQGFESQTLLETLYYSGIICMAVKDLPRAALYFRLVSSLPCLPTMVACPRWLPTHDGCSPTMAACPRWLSTLRRLPTCADACLPVHRPSAAQQTVPLPLPWRPTKSSSF